MTTPPTRIVTFGEIMLRLSPPGRALLVQADALDLWIAGAEANVATQLARLGHDAALVSALPPGALGDRALTGLRAHGVNTAQIVRRPGRMGLYFVISGASLRPTEVLYDRAGSSFATAPVDTWGWRDALAGATRLHLSGITPALGPEGTAAALAAAAAAQDAGVPVSFDGNYRARLWEAWDGKPRETLLQLTQAADVLFGSHRDIALLLDRPFAGDTQEARREAAQAAFAHFPRLQWIACTVRAGDHVDSQHLAARIDRRDGGVETPPVEIGSIVDRIGAGDAFAAGVLHALCAGQQPADVARTGLALAVLKHSIPGDAALFTQDDIDHYLAGGLDVRR
jgi:2-dehydro-3-deoxygluconokinase